MRTELIGDAGRQGRAGVLISEDKGATWNPYGDISTPQTWLIEQTVVEVLDWANTMDASLFISICRVLEYLD